MATKLDQIEKSVMEAQMALLQPEPSLSELSEVLPGESDLSICLENKKKPKKRQKKAKGKPDETDLLLAACIAENRAWPNQVAKAITTIRRITSQTQLDYAQCRAEGTLQEWPDEASLRKAAHPDDFRLKELKFLAASQHCQEQYGCSQVRAGAVVSGQLGESPILAASFLNPMQDLGAPLQTFSLDFLYEKTEHGGV